jgi:hypothetical protein
MAQQGYPNSPPLQVPANVYELMISHQLGRPLALYWEGSSAWIGVILIVVGVLCELPLLPVLLLLGLLLTQISVANLLTLQGLGVALLLLVWVLVGLLIGWGGFRLLTAPLEHLYLCEEAVVSLTGRREIVMRWDQVTNVTRCVTRGSGRNRGSSRLCCLLRSDGAALIIHESSFEQGGALCGYIEQQVAHKQLPQVRASYPAGIPISFGDLTVTQQGLSLDNGRKTLPWSEVGTIKISSNYVLSIGKQGKFWDWYSNGNMPNAWTVLELMDALGRK